MSAPPAACVTCGTPLAGRYCQQCGERVRTAEDLRVRRFLGDAIEGAFDVDSRLWRSLRTLVVRPGELTAEYVRGRRRPYLNPLQLFLLANLLFFGALSTIGGFNTYTTELRYHYSMPGYGDTAAELVEARAGPAGPKRADFERRFDETTPRYANSLVILMVPMFALCVWLLHGGRHPFAQHLVFALHFYAWMLLLLAVFPLPMRLTRWLARLVLDDAAAAAFALHSGQEYVTVPLLLGALGWYLVSSLRRSYATARGRAIARGISLAVLVFPVIIAYRAVLFFAVYYTFR